MLLKKVITKLIYQSVIGQKPNEYGQLTRGTVSELYLLKKIDNTKDIIMNRV